MSLRWLEILFLSSSHQSTRWKSPGMILIAIFSPRLLVGVGGPSFDLRPCGPWAHAPISIWQWYWWAMSIQFVRSHIRWVCSFVGWGEQLCEPTNRHGDSRSSMVWQFCCLQCLPVIWWCYDSSPVLPMRQRNWRGGRLQRGWQFSCHWKPQRLPSWGE